jgi:predicted ribosomally synthesized peptide with SipW-like signal peptide
MRKKAILLLASAVAMALGVSAGTYALFTASTSPANNHFVAGTLAIDSYRDNGDTIPGPMFYTTAAEGASSPLPPASPEPGLYPTGVWAPGDEHVRVLIVENVGSLDAWLVSVGADDVTGDATGKSMYLANKLDYWVATDAGFTNILASGKLGALISAPTDVTFTNEVPSEVGTPTEIQRLYFKVKLPRDADNSYQEIALKVDFHVSAVQMANNPNPILP